jgi:hypothetical protein
MAGGGEQRAWGEEQGAVKGERVRVNGKGRTEKEKK